MIKLTIFPPALNLKSASPFSIKAELFLKMAAVDYEIVIGTNPAKSPNGKFPLIEDNGQVITDSHHIFDHLCNNYGLNIDSNLNDDQKMLGHAFTRLVEDHLYWVLVYSRWVDDEHCHAVDQMLSEVPQMVRFLVKRIATKEVKKNLYGHGLSRHKKEVIYQKGMNDLNAIIHQLSKHDYFLDDQPSSYDAIIYAILACFYYPTFQTEMHKLLKNNEIVKNYLNRIENHFDYHH